MTISTFKLEEYLAKYEFTAKYLLCCSDTESYKVSDLIAMASAEERKLWENLTLGYTEVPGLPALRAAIAKQLYPGLTASNILTFVGAEEGIFCSLYALIDAEDHVIVLTPCYQSLLEIPKLKGAAISEIELKEENQWRIDLQAIKSEIKKNTKCIIINFPHNPTGQVIEQDELAELINICADKGIWLFSDEVYRLLGNPHKPWASPSAILYNKAISLGVMSKAFGMGGLRLGWIACQDQTVLKSIERMKHYTSISNSAPSEILTLIAINSMQEILHRNNEIVAANLKRVDEFISKHSDIFSWVKPQGGCVGLVKYRAKNSVDAFCEKLVTQKSVLLMPASILNYNSQHFRIGFGRMNLPECLAEFEDFLGSSL